LADKSVAIMEPEPWPPRSRGDGVSLPPPIPSNAKKCYRIVAKENSMTEVSLDLHFDRFVETEVQSGRFQDAIEVIQAGLRLLEREEARQDSQVASAIRHSFEETGADVPIEDVFAGLEQLFANDVRANLGACGSL
jgi:antitoxin ParD1/3/4